MATYPHTNHPFTQIESTYLYIFLPTRLKFGTPSNTTTQPHHWSTHELHDRNGLTKQPRLVLVILWNSIWTWEITISNAERGHCESEQEQSQVALNDGTTMKLI